MQPDTTMPRTPPGSYKYFLGKATQSGTNAPVVTELTNTIGPITWQYNDQGYYQGHRVGAFPQAKARIASIDNGSAYQDTLNAYQTNYAFFANGDDDNVWIATEFNGQLTDGQMTEATIQIWIEN